MQEFLILGKGMTTHPSVPSSLLADVFESLVAAIYLDGGDAAARRFIYRRDRAGNRVGGRRARRAATTSRCLQQLAQREHGTTPTYQLLDEKGPDHSKCFKIAAQVGGSRYQPAWGRNKKEAEQRAARNALSQLSGADAAVSVGLSLSSAAGRCMPTLRTAADVPDAAADAALKKIETPGQPCRAFLSRRNGLEEDSK